MIRIASNFRRLEEITASRRFTHEFTDPNDTAMQFVRKCLRAQLVILNVDQRKLMLACLVRWLWPFARFRLISVDLILRRPATRLDRTKARLKRILLRRVDRFVLYFNNLAGYQTFYGIGPDRVVYVPFKVNGSQAILARPRGNANGKHVICAGRTLRDVSTFVEAMKIAGCPGILLQQRRELLAAHGTSSWADELPSNLQLTIDESDSFEAYLDYLEKARLVVIPRFKIDIAPTGISTYLVAMALNKCVIISEGPGAEDVLTDQAIIVPIEDPQTLAEKITELWNNHELRKSVADRAYDYAMSLGGHKRLLADVLRVGLQTLSEAKQIEAGSYSHEAETIR